MLKKTDISKIPQDVLIKKIREQRENGLNKKNNDKFELWQNRVIKKVLVVEDELSHQSILVRMLNKILPDAEVKVCGLLSQAENYIMEESKSNKALDVVISDQNLPDGLGIDLWKKHKDLLKGVLFFVTSSMTENEFNETSKNIEGKVFFISKYSKIKEYQKAFEKAIAS